MAVRRKFSLAMFGFVFGLGGKSISDKVLGGKELIMDTQGKIFTGCP